MIQLWETLGTLVFCVSGAIAARQKDMDWFGMFILAFVTGAGGGLLRSLLIGDVPPVFLRDPTTFLLAAVGTVLALAGGELWKRVHRAVSVIDALGLSLFTVAGIRIAQDHGLPWWSCVALGVITATFGGVLRDVLRNEIPLILRKEIYATACLLGGLVLYGLDLLGVPHPWGPAIASILIVTVRLLAIRYAIHQSEG